MQAIFYESELKANFNQGASISKVAPNKKFCGQFGDGIVWYSFGDGIVWYSFGDGIVWYSFGDGIVLYSFNLVCSQAWLAMLSL